ncbi:MAG: DUF4139 domain-containing protein [Pseudomonadota bacterium]
MTVKFLQATVVAVALSLSVPVSVQADTSITIYSRAQPGAVNPDLYRPTGGSGYFYGQSLPGYAIVRDDRKIELPRGRSEFQLTDVAALIDPTTVSFGSLTDPDGTRVVEQDFRFDLVGTAKLLSKYIDQTITVTQGRGADQRQISGTLLSIDGGMVLQREDGSVEILTSWEHVRLGALPGGLLTRPTLVWDVTARRAGTHDTRISYETKGMTWWADYNLVWQPSKRNDNVGTLSVGAWVSLVNQSGTSFPASRLKLIAGDVQRAPSAQSNAYLRRQVQEMAFAEAADVAGFEEKSFFEFHLYTLGRTTDLPNNATKQIELFPQADAVPAIKRLIYNGFPQGRYASYGNYDRNFGAQSNPKVDVYLEFDNREKGGLGVPLPAGRVRVSQLDSADDSLEFIGEDVLDHTAKNQTIRLRLGSAFDVVGERKQTDFLSDRSRRLLEETIEITLTNRKDQAQAVTIAESLYRYANWEIVDTNVPFTKIDSRTLHFDVDVPADGKRILTFKVRYTW